MLTTRDLLAAVKARHNIPSNYALAKFLEVRENDVSRWNTGKNTPNDAMAVRLAELAGMDPTVVLSAMQAARCNDDALRPIWERIAESIQRSAAVVGLVVAGAFSSAPNPAQAAPSPLGNGPSTSADPINLM